MKLSFGYLKDCFAFFSFIICIIVVKKTKNLNELRYIIYILLTLAIIADGIFTFFPSLHNTIIEI